MDIGSVLRAAQDGRRYGAKAAFSMKKKHQKKSKKNLKKHLTFQILCGNIYKSSRRNGDEQKIVSVDDGEGPPVPIPNTEVKLTCADSGSRV